jgi:hypothetical protein
MRGFIFVAAILMQIRSAVMEMSAVTGWLFFAEKDCWLALWQD